MPQQQGQVASFRTPAALRRWLAKHHATKLELTLVFYKVGSGTPSVTWPQSVDGALCYGWIDGVRRRIDDDRYSIRFTPRRKDSKWSAVNLKRIEALTGEGRMHASGLAIHGERRDKADAGYTYQRKEATLPPEYLERIRRNRTAWKFFDARAPSYKRLVAYWVTSAKKEETRERRLEKLVAACAAGKIL